MTAATGEFFPSSSSLKSARCMKYLVCLIIYKIFLYPLGVQKIWVLFWLSSSNGYKLFFFSPPNFADFHRATVNLEPQILGFHFDD